MGAKPVSRPSHTKPSVALMLQGGGALGAYHIGAYQAMAEHELHPDWVAGISIGAINSAVIAGNRPEDRVARLTALWDAISWPDMPSPLALTALQMLHNVASNAEALLFGQPHFFTPRPLNPYFRPPAPAQEVSFYDTSPMLETLGRFADFSLINDRMVRLSLGATDIATGELQFFDNHRQHIGPEHVLASCSLPPGFPATLVGGRLYWDGGCVSNTPLDAVVDEPGHPNLVVFLIDLWDAAGPPPETMTDVLWRAKQIQYASRTAHHVDAVATKVNLRHAVRLLKSREAPEVATMPDDPVLAEKRLDIVHIIYHPEAGQIPNSDVEFSRSSIAERRAAGYRDMQVALAAEPWQRTEKAAHLGALVHRVERQTVRTLPEPNLRTMSDRTAAA
ncbi:MAG TPA: patatin-like phospholipase family protein [Acetobacteraceae bacterium]|jgi:NTE family protein|nr:patatin-like phospholipase family protein [Acetobacteraceae bacterium]